MAAAVWGRDFHSIFVVDANEALREAKRILDVL